MPRTTARVVVLCDNETSGPACACEWGLSLAVDLGDEGNGGLWLWDTGQTELFVKNAAALGVDVSTARGLALSHGHYDHTGGLPALFAAGFTGTVHAHPSCAAKRYAKEKGKPLHIGPPSPLPPFLPAGPLTELAPGLTLLTDIPRAPGRFQAVQGFSLDQEGREPDHVPDDAFLVLETRQGPVAILGCCHSGLANSLACARERLGLRSFHAVLGGLHLFNAGEEAVRETAEALTRFGVRQLVAGHCTGHGRTEALRTLLPGIRVEHLAAGQSWSY
ncbi:MAG TPA: MBL fold metallo-hydrolase [Humidesulfovibrio sp.]|uniref:MBL fold metallo-hydrolase n=1 Tax=Humidesulfovibrio sp. TaxID=2910988 RepID=UPI002BFC87BB|nr:MBL fold metallo-hydrolase [Humidesulfovibrio sp.]HWR02420.1 MBL fold metallo-hydrolase [Humidesulfovibrio sp.]